MEIALIAAVADDGVIGFDGSIPWDYEADKAHFRETTTGHPVIVGRRTFDRIVDTLGEPLPDRRNIVLTTDPSERDDFANVEYVTSVGEAVERAQQCETAYVAGGGSVYDQFLPLADSLVITHVPGSYDGDTRFPEWDDDEWSVRSSERVGDLSIVRYVRATESV
ncbi:dihydrofolate reductase [Halomicrobium salinisoli]|uniref:dihydrofolate reductase n=1 Tax=Halomicrobium salinisoli TaxID=2878391 RepID=UPI001CF03898|nr:dihydrofolate reductase [Halomicrobium salinisoli]